MAIQDPHLFFFHNESDSDTSSLNSGPLFREDELTTTDSDTEQPDENPDIKSTIIPLTRIKAMLIRMTSPIETISFGAI